MRRHIVFIIICFIAFAGCKNTSEITDLEFEGIMSSPRELERFHYIGTHGKYDFFVGEQWSMHSFGPTAKKTERYLKIKNSSYVNQRFPVTKDTQRWILLDQLSNVNIEIRSFSPSEEQLKELGFDWTNKTNSPNQQVEPTLKTPVESGKTQGSAAHP